MSNNNNDNSKQKHTTNEAQEDTATGILSWWRLRSEFEKALSLYRDALGRFTTGLKYEKNEARRSLSSNVSRAT